MTKMYKEILQASESVQNALTENSTMIDTIAKEIKKRKVKCVYFSARGTSMHAGLMMKYLIETYVGIPCAMAAPSIFTAYNGKLLLKNCLVLAISQSGAGQDVLEVLERGREQGALTVAMTNCKGSKIDLAAEYSLDLCCFPEEAVAATKSFICQLALGAALTARLSGDKELKKELKALPKLIEKVYRLEPKLDPIAQRYYHAFEGFIVARGLLTPIAFEAALKTQETTYSRFRGMPMSEFLHGPIAQVEAHMPVIVFAADTATDAFAEGVLRRLKEEIGAEVFLITNKPELLPLSDLNILLPAECEGFSGGVGAILLIQLFVLKLSALRGIDTDNPRGLNKVTITR